MSQQSVSDRIFDRLGKKFAAIGYRTDLSVADMRTHSNSAASLLLSYNPVLGEVTGQDLSTYFLRTFDCKVIPRLESARLHKPGVISVIAEVVTKKRPIDDKGKMMAIGEARFIDTALNETYEVREHNGVKFLANICPDDIAAIVAERNKRMAITGATRVSFEQVEAGCAICDAGDKVKFYYNDAIMTGEVKSVADSKIVIKADSGETITTEKSAVIEMLAKSPDAMKKSADAELAYYTQMYGSEEFARQLMGMSPVGPTMRNA